MYQLRNGDYVIKNGGKILSIASQMPELHFDLLEYPNLSNDVDIAMDLVSVGYLKNLGGISQEEYSFKITSKGRRWLKNHPKSRVTLIVGTENKT